jgi:hypothetical protein
MAAGIDHFRFADRSNTGDCGSLVRRDGRLRKLRYGKCRDDQNNGYDDQQFDEGKSPVSVTFTHNWQPFSAALVSSHLPCQRKRRALHRRAPSGAGTRHSAFPPTPRLSWSQRVALDFFLGGFLASRFGAFLFPMPTASHRFEDDARGQTLKLRHNLHFFHIQNL